MKVCIAKALLLACIDYTWYDRFSNIITYIANDMQSPPLCIYFITRLSSSAVYVSYGNLSHWKYSCFKFLCQTFYQWRESMKIYVAFVIWQMVKIKSQKSKPLVFFYKSKKRLYNVWLKLSELDIIVIENFVYNLAIW